LIKEVGSRPFKGSPLETSNGDNEQPATNRYELRDAHQNTPLLLLTRNAGKPEDSQRVTDAVKQKQIG
jgi:hypothetical protein